MPGFYVGYVSRYVMYEGVCMYGYVCSYTMGTVRTVLWNNVCIYIYITYIYILCIII